MDKGDLNIFLIDDNDIDIVVNTKLLTLARITDNIHSFQSGEEALDYFRRNIEELSKQRNTVLLDIQMPSMDGFECLQHFNEMPDSIQNVTTVYMLSSSLDRADIERAEENPLVGKVLEKPLDVYQLKQLLND